MTGESAVVSERSRGVTLALAIIGGVFGLHRFYAGKKESGIYMCLTVGGLGVWYIYDVVLVAAGEFRDVEGKRVLRWEVEEDSGSSSGGRVEALEERLHALEAETGELAERLDFAERMLAQQRGKERLPRGS